MFQPSYQYKGNGLQLNNKQMLEQLKIQKEIGLPAPQSPSNTNKLQLYFENSSFLHQQQELSIFIKDLPIISLKEIKSVNSLINLLIKQNQLIGQKCQQQVALLKQQYLKHDKLIKLNKEIKMEKEKAQKDRKQMQQKYNSIKFSSQKQISKQEELESKERKLQAENLKLNVLVKQTNQKISKLEELLSHICNQDYKRAQDYLKFNQFSNSNMAQNLTEFSQVQKRKQKYFYKIKNIVNDFCTRLQKIVKVVSPAVLAAQIGTQTANMMDLISEICDQQKSKKKKKKTEGSERNLSQRGGSSQKNINFFEGMILKLTQCAQNNSTTKQEIASQLDEVKSSLHQTKAYYQGVVKSLKEQFSIKEQDVEKKMKLKEETIKYYEEQVQKQRQATINLKQKNEVLQSEVVRLKRQGEEKDFHIESQQAKFAYHQKQSKDELQKLKNQTQMRIQELKKMAALKINQREQLITELSERRKKQQSQFEKEISELKFKIKLSQEEGEEKERQLKIHIKNVNNLQGQNQRFESTIKQLKSEIQRSKQKYSQLQDKLKGKTKQIDEFKQALNSLQHEKSLQNAYIGQLEAKVETLNNKIKSLESKAKNQATNKKQITAMKNTIVEQKQRSEQYQAYCAQIKDENSRLKNIVKEMKKQLEDVYIRLSELKQIEADRERLFLQAQNSERVREGLLKQHQQIKIEMLRLEAQNKRMQLELKHFKNIVSRIKILEES